MTPADSESAAPATVSGADAPTNGAAPVDATGPQIAAESVEFPQSLAELKELTDRIFNIFGP